MLHLKKVDSENLANQNYIKKEKQNIIKNDSLYKGISSYSNLGDWYNSQILVFLKDF